MMRSSFGPSLRRNTLFSGVGARLYHGRGREGGGSGVDGVEVVVKVEGQEVEASSSLTMMTWWVSDELAGCC